MKYLIAVLLALNTLSLETAYSQAGSPTPPYTSQNIANLCGVTGQCGNMITGLITGGSPGTFTSVTASTGGFTASTSGGTLSLQEATAGAKCMGSVTATGATAVTVATTCATTGARIFISRSSAPSGTAQCWTANLVAATSFDFDCDGAETGTFNWFIIKES